MSDELADWEKLFMDSDSNLDLHRKVDKFALTLQDHITDQLMLTFTQEELESIETIYGERFVYRMLPDVRYILAGPSPSGTIH